MSTVTFAKVFTSSIRYVFLGFIVRFEFGELSKYYFIDPEWLNKVFSSLVSQGSIKDCVIPGFGKHVILYSAKCWWGKTGEITLLVYLESKTLAN